jgi:hypothetical protein
VVDGTIQQRAQRELNPIRDDHELVFGNGGVSGAATDGYVFGSGNDAPGLPTTYLTPPKTSFLPSDSASSANSSVMYTGGSGEFDFAGGAPAGAAAGMLYTPAGPLPNPGFSFGSTPAMPDSASTQASDGQYRSQAQGQPQSQPGFAFGNDAKTREMELFFQFRDKGRLDSMASTNGYGSDGTTGTANGSMGQPEPWEWAQMQGQVQGPGHAMMQGQMHPQGAGLEGMQMPPGFNPERRASA